MDHIHVLIIVFCIFFFLPEIIFCLTLPFEWYRNWKINKRVDEALAKCDMELEEEKKSDIGPSGE